MEHATKPVGWARVWPAVRPPYSRNFRQGAWYPVVRDDASDRVTITMYGRAVDVPRRIIEVRPRRPAYFSVVLRIGYDGDPRRKSLHDLGKKYAVCPKCAWRFALFGQPEQKQCPSCSHEGEVGWWEQ